MDDEAWEDSDDGDDEGREVDYMTDESSSSGEEPDVKAKDDLKGVEDEEALRKMEESESEEENPDAKKEPQEEVKEETPTKEKPTKEKKEKKEDSSSENTSDTSDSDDFDNDSNFQSAMFMQGSKKSGKKLKKERLHEGKSSSTSAGTSDRHGSGGAKRLISDVDKDGSGAKKPKLDNSSSLLGSGMSLDGISEDAVRRYLMRKPMTTTELLQKFKSKKTGLGRDQMVNTITQILKRLNPEKQMIKGKMYLSIKQSFA